MADFAADKQTELAVRIASGGGGRRQRAEALRQRAGNTAQQQHTEGATTKLFGN